MKLKDITRLSIRELDDAELAKIHSQLHGMDKSQDEDRKKREREIWEKHNFVAAELITRNQKHTSPLGDNEGTDSPASSNASEEGAEHAPGTETEESSSGADIEGRGGASDKPKHKHDPRIMMGKAYFLLSEMRDAIEAAFDDYSYMEEIDLDGPAVIAGVWVESEDKYVTYRIPFELTTAGIVLDVENKTEVEAKIVYTTKSVVITAPVIKESMDDEKRYALYMVYAPEADDSQGERMTKEDIEKACWSFGKKCYFAQGNRIDMQHSEDMEKHGECMVVENFVSREEGWMGKSAGTWFMGIIHGEEEWEMLKNGEINGVSMAGQAVREEREVEDE